MVNWRFRDKGAILIYNFLAPFIYPERGTASGIAFWIDHGHVGHRRLPPILCKL